MVPMPWILCATSTPNSLFTSVHWPGRLISFVEAVVVNAETNVVGRLADEGDIEGAATTLDRALEATTSAGVANQRRRLPIPFAEKPVLGSSAENG